MNDAAVLTSTEAREEFGWSRDLMTKLLRSGALPFTTDPLDKRLKWVKRSDVARLNEASHKRQRRTQPAHDMASSQVSIPSAASIALSAKAAASSSRPAPVPFVPPTVSNKKDIRAAPLSRTNRLKPSDQVVLAYLRTLCAVTGTDTTPPVGYETIAQRCGICPRQAQICCDRLVRARRLERLGYDAGNPDLTRRGMMYRVTGAGHHSIEVTAHARRRSCQRT